MGASFMSMAQLTEPMRREWRFLRKDRTTLSLLLLLPVVQLLLFGFAIRPEQQRTPVALAIAQGDRAAQIEAAIAQTPQLDLVATRLPPGGAEAMVTNGKALIAIEVPPLATFDDEAPQKPVRVLADMSNPAAVGPALQALEASYWKRLAQAGPLGNVSALKVEVVALHNPQRRSAWAFAPSLIGVAIMVSMLLFGALSADRAGETQAGNSTATIAGKCLVYAVLALAQALLVIILSVLLFDLPVRGSLVALLLIVPPYAIAHVLAGFIIAARAAQPMQAVQSCVAFYFPAMILSGFLYPFEAMPDWAQALGALLPLTHFIPAAREALLKGSDAATILAHLWPILLFMLAALAVLALTLNKKRPAGDAGRQ